VPVDEHLVVQMRAGRPPRLTEQPDLLLQGNLVALGDADAIEMGIACSKVEDMLDLDHVAVALVPAREDDTARRRCAYGRAERRLQVDSFVKGMLAVERIDAVAERAGDGEILNRGR